MTRETGIIVGVLNMFSLYYVIKPNYIHYGLLVTVLVEGPVVTAFF